MGPVSHFWSGPRRLVTKVSVSLSYLIDRVRLCADMVSSSFVTDDELTKYINAAGAELHDLLISTSEDYLLTSSVFSINNNEGYAPDETVLKVAGLDWSQGGRFFPCAQFNFNERFFANSPLANGMVPPTYHWLGNSINIYPEQSCGGTYKLWFVVGWEDLVQGSHETLSRPYTHNHWEEYIVLDAASRALQKEESDVSVLMAQKERIALRIRSAASNRDSSGGKVVADVRPRWGLNGMAGPAGDGIFTDVFGESFL